METNSVYIMQPADLSNMDRNVSHVYSAFGVTGIESGRTIEGLGIRLQDYCELIYILYTYILAHAYTIICTYRVECMFLFFL